MALATTTFVAYPELGRDGDELDGSRTLIASWEVTTSKQRYNCGKNVQLSILCGTQEQARWCTCITSSRSGRTELRLGHKQGSHERRVAVEQNLHLIFDYEVLVLICASATAVGGSFDMMHACIPKWKRGARECTQKEGRVVAHASRIVMYHERVFGLSRV